MFKPFVVLTTVPAWAAFPVPEIDYAAPGAPAAACFVDGVDFCAHWTFFDPDGPPAGGCNGVCIDPGVSSACNKIGTRELALVYPGGCWPAPELQCTLMTVTLDVPAFRCKWLDPDGCEPGYFKTCYWEQTSLVGPTTVQSATPGSDPCWIGG